MFPFWFFSLIVYYKVLSRVPCVLSLSLCVCVYIYTYTDISRSIHVATKGMISFFFYGWVISCCMYVWVCGYIYIYISLNICMEGNQSWIFLIRTDAEAETLRLWPPDAKNWLTGKDPDAGKDWRQEEKGTTEDEMVGWHHWLNGHEFE